jgi:hypothetical protein
VLIKKRFEETGRGRTSEVWRWVGLAYDLDVLRVLVLHLLNFWVLLMQS